jgi:hypothetical protein
MTGRINRHKSNEQRLSVVLEKLGPMKDHVVLVGATAAGFLITDPGAAEVRAALDLDLLADIVSLIGYAQIEKALGDLGFQRPVNGSRYRFELPQGDDAPLLMDFMTTEEGVLEFKSMWFTESFKTAVPVTLRSGQKVGIISAPCFLATKIEAFLDRGTGEYRDSKDLSDLILVIAGRPLLVDEVKVSSDQLRAWLADRFLRFLRDPNFEASLTGWLLPGPQSSERQDIVMDRIEQLTRI